MSPLRSATGMKSSGGIQPEHVVRPAGERLDAGVAARDQVADGLVVDPDVAAVDRRPQLVLQVEALADPGAEHLVVQLDPAAALLLGAVHGGIGAAQHALGVEACRGRRPPRRCWR